MAKFFAKDRPVAVPRRTVPVLGTVAFLILLCLAVWEVQPDVRHLVSATPAASLLAYDLVGSVPRLQVLYATADGTLYGVEDLSVFVSTDDGRTFRERGRLPRLHPSVGDRLADAVARRKVVRYFRQLHGPRNLVVLNSGTILVFWDAIYRSTDGGRTFQPVFHFHTEGVAQPFLLNGQSVTVGPDDTVYFGEYTVPGRGVPVRILRGREDGRRWDVAYTFAPGEILHVHSVAYDRYRQRYWVCTGDWGDEARVLYTDDGFRHLHQLGAGAEDWRATVVVPTADHLYWGGDGDWQGAGIFRWSFARRTLERVQWLGKPSYAATQVRDGTLFVSTAYEPESPFTRANHPPASADLWTSRDGLQWSKVATFPYQQHALPTGHLSRATIAFPGGAPTRDLFYTPLSTSEANFSVQVLRTWPRAER